MSREQSVRVRSGRRCRRTVHRAETPARRRAVRPSARPPSLVRRPHHRRDLDGLGARARPRPRERLVERARTSGSSSRGASTTSTSAAISVRASRVSPLRTLWMTDRSATMPPTPSATQTKKNSSRLHEARISRTAMRRTKLIARRRHRARVLGIAAAVAEGELRFGQRRQRRIVRHEHERRLRARLTSSSRSMTWRPLVLSRLPVGSSASRIGGSLASARAIATRCCSPPDSCDG